MTLQSQWFRAETFDVRVNNERKRVGAFKQNRQVLNMSNRFKRKVVACFLVAVALASSCPGQVNSLWNGTSGNWSDFTRWNSNPLYPNNGNGGDNYNVTINAGTVVVDLPITIDALNFGGGTISLTNNLTTNGPFIWNFGSLSGPGKLLVAGGGTLNSTSIVNGGTLQFGDGVNTSTVTHNKFATLLLNNGAQASIKNGTTYEMDVTSSGSNFGSSTGTPGTFTVETGGVLRKLGGGTHLIANNVVLNNQGTIEVNQGTLWFENSTATWANSGQIDMAAGTIVHKGTGTMNLDAGSTISGSGTFSQLGGMLNANADNSISRLQMDSGIFNRSANTTTTISENLTWNGGSLTGAGILQVAGGGTLNSTSIVNGGTLQFGDGVNTSTVTHTKFATLLLNNGAQASVQNGTTYEMDVTSSGSNFGSSTGTPGRFTVETGGILRKLGGGTHLIANNVVLNNQGTIEVNQGSLQFFGNSVLENSGLIRVNAGILDFTSGGPLAPNNGTIIVSPAAMFRGSLINDSSGLLGGAGTITGAVSLLSGGGITAGIDETFTTLSLQDKLNMGDDSFYTASLLGLGPTAISKLAVTGDVDIANGANLRLDLSLLSGADVSLLRTAIGEGNTRSYTVIATAGTVLGGSFDAGNFAVSDYGSFVPNQWLFAARTTANSVEIDVSPLIAVPEPAYLMLAAGGLGLMLRRRRKGGRSGGALEN